jgi:hypothetical protein
MSLVAGTALLTGAQTPAPKSEANAVRPFRINVPEAATLNALPQFVTEIDGLDILLSRGRAAVTSRRGNSRNSSPPRSEQRSDRCAKWREMTTVRVAWNAGARLSVPVTVAVLCVLVSMVSPSHAPLFAADGRQAIDIIAKILLDFTHVPSVSQKATLQGILDEHTTTVAEQVLAQALINVEHIASPDDKPRLEALIRDESAPPAVKTLATILKNLTHTPTDVDKKKLRQLLHRSGAHSSLRPGF